MISYTVELLLKMIIIVHPDYDDVCDITLRWRLLALQWNIKSRPFHFLKLNKLFLKYLSGVRCVKSSVKRQYTHCSVALLVLSLRLCLHTEEALLLLEKTDDLWTPQERLKWRHKGCFILFEVNKIYE